MSDACFQVLWQINCQSRREEYDLYPGTAIFSPLGVEHEIINVGDEPFKIVWAYAPPLPEHLKDSK